MKHYDDVVAAAAAVAVAVATWHADNNGHKPAHWEIYSMKLNIKKSDKNHHHLNIFTTYGH